MCGADLGTSVAAAVNRAVFSNDPLAWWLERRLAALAEEACDAAAIRSTGDGPRYAGVVLEFAAAACGADVGGDIDGAVQPVDSRIRRMLEARPVRDYAITGGAWAVMLALALPVVYAAAALQLEPHALRQAAVAADSGLAGKDSYLSILGEGWQVTPEGAAQLESGLVGDPDKDLVRATSSPDQLLLPADDRGAAGPSCPLAHREPPRGKRVPGCRRRHRHALPGLGGSDHRAEVMTVPGSFGWSRRSAPADTRNPANAAAALSDPEVQLRLVRHVRAVEPGNPDGRPGWHRLTPGQYGTFSSRVMGEGPRSFTGAEQAARRCLEVDRDAAADGGALNGGTGDV